MRLAEPAAPLRHLLMIAYHFPPFAGIGGQRALRFARALPAYGWRVTVITCDRHRGAVDAAILGADEPFTVLRVPAHLLPSRPYRLMMWLRWHLLPDEALRWSREVAKVARSIETPVDAVWSTAMPFSAHVAAARLAAEFDVPWVADFRDPYVDNPYVPGDRLRERRAAIQARTLASASRITTVSPGQMATLGEHAGRATFLPNGWDARDFSGVVTPQSGPPWTLRVVGTVYGRQVTDIPLAAALEQAQSAMPGLAERLTVEFVGKVAPEARADIEARDPGFVRFTGPLPRAEAIRLMREAHALMLLNPSGPGRDDVLTGKVFEYWASGRPILALSGDSTVSRWLRETGTGTVVPYADAGAIAEALCSLATKGPEALGGAAPEFAARFGSDAQAAELAGLLDAAVGEHAVSHERAAGKGSR